MFEIAASKRQGIIESLLQYLPADKRDQARKETNEIADLFEGQDMNAMGLLYRAAEARKFDEFTAKLRDYYKNEGQYVTPANRGPARNKNIGVLRDIVKKEREISEGTRDRADRRYWPQEVQTLANEYLGSVKMELFFADCFEEVMGISKP